jgi:NAD-dependent DNA ligase
MAILLTEDHHLIEFPSLLLPNGVTSGSVVNISVLRNLEEEERQAEEFWNLEEAILEDYGTKSPQPPVLCAKTVTQTSVTLEWEPLVLENASLRSLDIYKNNAKLTQHHIPAGINFVKLSGLDVDQSYEFHVVIKTSAGAYTSNKVQVRTHKMDNLTGIHVAFGGFEVSEPAVTDLKELIDKISAKWSDEVTSDTTHLLAQVPGGSNYERALQLSIPIVKPEWIVQCEKNRKIQPALPYYIVHQND